MIELTQGVTEEIYAKSLTDATGLPLDPTGWTIHAAVCQYGPAGPVVATWRNSPGAGEGLAEVVNATDSSGTKWIVLHCTPALSDSWSWSRGLLQCVITAPSGSPPPEARVIDDDVVVNPQCVPEE